MNTMNPLDMIQQWYRKHCDGDWEHQYGIVIKTLDNPGWSLTIDLEETDLKDKRFDEVVIERGENDWVFCKVESKQFKGACGPNNLSEILTLFCIWATA